MFIDPSWQQAALSMLQQSTLEVLQGNIGKLDVDPKVFGRIMHLEVNSNFDRLHVRLASDYFKEELASRCYAEALDNLWSFLNNSSRRINLGLRA